MLVIYFKEHGFHTDFFFSVFVKVVDFEFELLYLLIFFCSFYREGIIVSLSLLYSYHFEIYSSELAELIPLL